MLLVLFTLVFVATVFIPGPVIVVLLINTIIGLILSLFQMRAALLPHYQPKRKKPENYPMISILVPSYNEPPAILMRTLEALAHLQYSHYEVLVIDNNTRDPSIWKPVEAFVRALGKPFRFFHVEGLRGFKAGALNYLLERTDAKSAYVLIVDADYIVRPNILLTAISYCTDSDIALVQFPQRYRNRTPENEPIADEYDHFFKIYMNMANHFDCVPSTGTVSMYRLDALRRIGGFRPDALTEDADAGLRIYEAGYRGVYVDHPVGEGLMPYDIEAYRTQKWRWAVGNVQSLAKLFSLVGKIPWRTWIGFLSHLTAWDHLHFLPFAVLAAYALVVTPVIPTTDTHRMLLNVASLSIFITVLFKLIIFLVAFRAEDRYVFRAVKAFVVHMGMTLLYSEALLMLFRRDVEFERTNKFIVGTMPSLLKNTYKELFLGTWFLIGLAAAVAFGARIITITAFLVSACALFSIYYVYWKILPTKAYSKRLIARLETRYHRYL